MTSFTEKGPGGDPGPHTAHATRVVPSQRTALDRHAQAFVVGPEPPPKLHTRFWAKVAFGPGCWIWTAGVRGGLRGGYGLFSLDGRMVDAHRVAYELLIGPVPARLTLDHLCRNRPCVRPDHLEPVSGRVNTLRGDSLSARNARVTHCPQGHRNDLFNTYVHNGMRFCRACRNARSRSHRKGFHR